MSDFDAKAFARCLREVPQKHILPEEAEHSEYLQKEVFDLLIQGEDVNLAELDWDAFALRHVTPMWYSSIFERAEERLTKGMKRMFQTIAPARSLERRFF